MKIIVFGAAGDVGRRVVAEALFRKHEVTAVVRRLIPDFFDPSVQVMVRDVSSATDLVEQIKSHDLVISALRPPAGEDSALLPLTQTVVEASRAAGVRFVIVGGAASLLVPGTSGHTVLTAPGFLPQEVIPIATACQQQYEWCINNLDKIGAYVCPPALLMPGERSGVYRTGSDMLVLGDDGQSRISIEDFAVALLDEGESLEHAGLRTTVGY